MLSVKNSYKDTFTYFAIPQRKVYEVDSTAVRFELMESRDAFSTKRALFDKSGEEDRCRHAPSTNRRRDTRQLWSHRQKVVYKKSRCDIGR